MADTRGWTAVQRRRLREDLAGIWGRSTSREPPRLLTLDFEAEVLHAMYARPHERRRATFGAMTLVPYESEHNGSRISQMQIPLAQVGSEASLTLEDPVVLRQMCDGYSTMLWVDQSTPTVVSFERPRDELGCLAMSAGGFATVQRLGTGDVRLTLPEMLLNWSGATWSVKPHYSYVSALSGYSIPAVDSITEGLKAAMHVLSPGGVGATLIIALGRGVPGSDPCFDLEHAEDGGGLDLRNESHGTMIRSLAAQNDRALLFDVDGRLLRFGVSLTPDPSRPRRHVPYRGTRHTSALHASEDAPTYGFIVVSEDGPVTVMVGGRVLVSIREGNTTAETCRGCAGRSKVPAGPRPLGTAALGTTTFGGGRPGRMRRCPTCRGAGLVLGDTGEEVAAIYSHQRIHGR
jgi:hypothetical protein